jgi:hypothetical protein
MPRQMPESRAAGRLPTTFDLRFGLICHHAFLTGELTPPELIGNLKFTQT